MDSFETILEEYLSKLDTGDRPDREQFLARHPDHVVQLRTFFADLDLVDVSIARDKTLRGRAAISSLSSPGLDRPTDAIHPPSEPNIPLLRGFRVLEELGSGSQGIVYKAEQLGTKRMVALKVIREGAFASQAERRRFQNEVELASRLSHPNIVAVYECGHEAGHDYFAMQYVEGSSLDAYLADNTLDVPSTIRLFLQICDAVSYAHQRGVIHRDLKPSNLLVDSGGAVHILDFGLAREVRADASAINACVTQTGEFAGTWYYASPEQAKRDPGLVDVRTDVYSLGVIVYEMLTDCLPYPVVGESREVIARHVLETIPERPSLIRREIDDDLNTVVLCALRKESEQRYQSVAALRDDLLCFLSGTPISAKRDTVLYVLSHALRRYRWYVGVATAAVCLMLVFSIVVVALYSKAATAQATTELRSTLARRSQRSLLESLDELNWAKNHLKEIADAFPGLPQVARLKRTADADLRPPVLELITDMPDGLLSSVLARDGPEYEAAAFWLGQREPALVHVQSLLQTNRWVSLTHTAGDSDFAIAEVADSLTIPMRLCDVLTARAMQKYYAGHHEGSVAGFAAAQTITQDVADGRHLLQKTAAVMMFGAVLDALLRIFSLSAPDDPMMRGYRNWAMQIPPVPLYGDALRSERQRLGQLFEAAAYSSPEHAHGFLDLNQLDRLMGGTYARAAIRLEGVVVPETPVAPTRVLDALDGFIQEVSEWDQLPASTITDRWKEIQDRMRHQEDWAILAPILPNYCNGYQTRCLIRAKRSLTLVVTHLLTFRAREGYWPERLADAIPEAQRELEVDPYTAAPFIYRSAADGAPELVRAAVTGDAASGTSTFAEPAAPLTVLFRFPGAHHAFQRPPSRELPAD